MVASCFDTKRSNGDDRAISYDSRALSVRKNAFSAAEKEVLAALEQFHVYLQGVPHALLSSPDKQNLVTKCETCAQIKLNNDRNKTLAHPIEINEPFIFCAMDYIVPLTESIRGKRHLSVVMDYFTKWCEVFPIKDQTAKLLLTFWSVTQGCQVLKTL